MTGEQARLRYWERSCRDLVEVFIGAGQLELPLALPSLLPALVDALLLMQGVVIGGSERKSFLLLDRKHLQIFTP